MAVAAVAVLPVDRMTSEHYATVYAQLRRDGRPIPTNDMLIAATAKQHGLAVFSLDSHFTYVAGSRVVRSSADLQSP